jgi:AcrR family transcriptional regulator
MAATELGLRARKKQATAAALQRSAVELFLERGYDQTTVQDITDAAGVSQRTFFRYYPTKDAVLLTEHTRRERELAELLALRHDEPLEETARAAVAQLSADVAERLELVRVQARVSGTVPALADRFAGHHERLAVILAEHAAKVLGVGDATDARPRLYGQQVVRCWTTTILLWLTRGAEDDLVAMAADTLRRARTDPLLVDRG